VGGGRDSDSDGQPDIWESANGLNPSFNEAALDYDRDGLTNLQEYLAGTHPLDASSCLKIVGLRSADGIHLKFQAVAGRAYKIQYCDSLADNPWNTLTNVTPQVADYTADILDRPPAGGGARFYRLTTPQAP